MFWNGEMYQNMDTKKVTSKINEVDSKVEDMFLKHELQIQLMAEIWRE